MNAPDILVKTETHLGNHPIRLAYIPLSGQTDASIFIGYPILEFQRKYRYLIKERDKKNVTFDLKDATVMNDIIQEELPAYFETKLLQIRDSFSKEVLKKEELLKNKKEVVNNTFRKVSKFLAELDFQEISIEITKSDSMKFNLLFPQNKLLLITKSLFPATFELNDDEVIFSFFINRKLVISDVSELSAFTDGFKKYLSV